MLLAVSMLLLACKGVDAKASTTHGVSVNVPSKMDIVFHEDGTTTVSDMFLKNDSLVPVKLQSFNIKEFNGWKLVSTSQKILKNSKQLSLLLGGKEPTD